MTLTRRHISSHRPYADRIGKAQCRWFAILARRCCWPYLRSHDHQAGRTCAVD